MGAAKRFVHNPGRTAICYYRYSSDAQREASIDQQKKAAHDYADAHGYHIIQEYEDKAISGTRDDREQYNLMLYEVEILRPAYLIIWKTDRLSRDKIDIALAKKRLRECGVKIVYVAEAIPEDDEATEVLLESFYEGMAAAFIAGHRKNVMRGLRYNAENALYNGYKVFGYKGKVNAKYEIDPDEAPIVKEIFQEYIDGIPIKRICDDLNSKGLRTGSGKEFTHNFVHRVLTNQAYIGIYKWGDIIVEGGMPCIIDDETFERAAKKIAANQRGGKGAVKKANPETDIEDYWLTGHIFCGLCGESMQGVSGTSKSGVKHYYYSCKGHRHHRCTMHNKPKALIEGIVLAVLRDVVMQPAYRVLIAAKCYDYYKTKYANDGVYEASIKAQLKDTETKISNIMKAIEAGILTPTTGERLKVLEATQSRLKDALIAELNRQKFEIKPETIVKYLESFEGDLNDVVNRKRIMDDFIDKVIVTENTVAITFNYTNDRRQFPLEKIEGTDDPNYVDLETIFGEITDEMLSQIPDNLFDESEVKPPF